MRRLNIDILFAPFDPSTLPVSYVTVHRRDAPTQALHDRTPASCVTAGDAAELRTLHRPSIRGYAEDTAAAHGGERRSFGFVGRRYAAASACRPDGNRRTFVSSVFLRLFVLLRRRRILAEPAAVDMSRWFPQPQASNDWHSNTSRWRLLHAVRNAAQLWLPPFAAICWWQYLTQSSFALVRAAGLHGAGMEMALKAMIIGSTRPEV